MVKSMYTRLTQTAKTLLTLFLFSVVLSLNALGQGFTTVDFHQAQNDRGGAGSYLIDWVNGILNATHTDYYEGIGIPQRIVFTGIKPKPGNNANTHSLTFQVLAEKGGKHAYDFPISWMQAFKTAEDIGNGTLNELMYLWVLENGDAFSAPGKAAAIELTTAGSYFADSVTGDFPDVIGNPGKPALTDANVNDNITCFETYKRGGEATFRYGDRTIEIRGNKSFTGDVTIAFDGYKGSGRDMAQYTVTWTSESDKLLIRFATRLAPGAGRCGYGSGQGAGSINGGPYHVVLNNLDGVSLGSQDNQIMSNAIQIPPECTVTGPTSACEGSIVTFSTTLSATAYNWALTNASGATPQITAGQGTNQITVNVGTNPGTFSVTLTATTSAGPSFCSLNFTVNDNPDKPFVDYLEPPCDATHFSITVGSTGNPIIAGATYTVTDKCGQTITGLSPASYTAPASNPPTSVTFSGIPAGAGYKVTVTTTGNCTATETCGTCPTPSSVTKASAPTEEVQSIDARIFSKEATKVLAAPNPFTDRVRFTLRSDVSGQGSLELYNTMGQKIATVYQGHVEAGKVLSKEYVVKRNLRANIIYVFRVGDQKTTGKLLNW